MVKNMIKEKVYINRISVDYQTLYARAKDYFHRHGIEIDFTFIPSDYKNLTYRIANFPQGQRILLQPTMSQVVPIDNSYDITSFVFNGREFTPPNIPTGFCYVPTKQPFIDILTDELNPKDLDYVTICHEHMHALTYLANQKGFNIPDLMDDYWNNMQLESANSNFGRQWVLLRPYLKSLQAPPSLVIPKVVIKRNWDDGTQFLGDLTMTNFSIALDKFECKTLELSYKLNAPNISCIPKGIYLVKWTWSWKFMRYTYEVQAVPSRSGIRFHPANFWFNLLGCIALGDKYGDLNSDKWADLINSKVTVAKFEQFLNKRDFQLEIL